MFSILSVYVAKDRTLPWLSEMEFEASHFRGISIPHCTVIAFLPLCRIPHPGLFTRPANPQMPLALAGLLLLQSDSLNLVLSVMRTGGFKMVRTILNVLGP